MDCRQFRRQYSAYRDAHDPALAADMDDHMETCPECAAYDHAIRSGVDALRGETILPSPDFMARLAARIASGEVVPEPVPPRVSPVVATLAAALFIMLVGITAVKDLLVAPTPVAAEEPPFVVAEPKLIAGVPFVTFQHIGEPEAPARP